MAKSIKEIIYDLKSQDIPTHVFTIEDEDPHVILGKITEVIHALEAIDATISSSDAKAKEALDTAMEALRQAEYAITNLYNINETATSAENKANNALIKATEALNQVVAGLGTKVYRDTELLSSYDVKPLEADIENLSINKVDKEEGKGLSSNDFTNEDIEKITALENNKLDKIESPILPRLYGIKDGNQTTYGIIATSAIEGYIPMYQAKGHLPVGYNPTANNHATNKEYVDNTIDTKIANKADKETIDTLAFVSSNMTEGQTITTTQPIANYKYIMFVLRPTTTYYYATAWFYREKLENSTDYSLIMGAPTGTMGNTLLAIKYMGNNKFTIEKTGNLYSFVIFGIK